ncbi:PIN domain-containing protein [Kribbella sp. VKM Ac-2571]|uniref:type II toxin-antitoxin system VapC family toxin n=1 Tax=Kribbella sp. VKM Ac-2571 TaxID=2512222 RepID=UPI0010E69295|nr:PIN domain-containing protein [Kribbella sp. VKM Ac-2571]TDO68504.1 PIN domain-containing protein [Kribbella sp. VKM Ac-2571]
MSPRKRVPSAPQGSLVLDNEGLSRAATDRAMYVRLYAAHADGRRVVTSAAILAEALRGSRRDAAVYRVLSGIVVEPVSRALGERAGQLIGAARLGSGQAVDAILVATALAEPGPVVIATSDAGDLKALVGDEHRIAVVAADRL